MPNRDLAKEAREWAHGAAALAAWADTHLVTRRDAWGTYIPPYRRRPNGPTSYTAKGSLALRHLARHFSGAVVLGLHASDGERSRWLGFDLDAHDGSEDTRAANLEAAARLCTALRNVGAVPLVEASDGRGGLHVWTLFDTPVPTPNVFHFGDGIRAALGLAGVETFPKQASIPAGGYGNWLRLPGRHHSRAHWSRVARDGRWLAGRDAVGAFLAHPLTPASCVPVAPPVAPLAVRPLVTAPTFGLSGDRARASRLAAYCRKVEHGLSDGRRRAAYRLGAAFLHDFGISLPEARALLAAWNAANLPPLSDAALGVALENARRYGRGGGRAA